MNMNTKLNRYIGLSLMLALLLVCGCVAKKPKVAAEDYGSLNQIGLDAIKAYESGQHARSLDLYHSLVALEPKNHVYRNNMGVILLENGRAQEALDAFEEASLLAPENADYLVNVGFAQIKLDDLEESLDFFDRALQMTPGHPRAVYGKGVAYLYLNEPEMALGFFHQALMVEPGNREAMFMRAYAAQKNHLFADAVKDYTEYIQKSDEKFQKANAYSNRALCYYQLGDFPAGMLDIDQAMQINDASSTFYYNRAQGYQMQHKYEDAVKDYTRAISRKASFPEAYINRGELNYFIGKETKGCSDLKRACDLGYCGPFEKYESAEKCTD